MFQRGVSADHLLACRAVKWCNLERRLCGVEVDVCYLGFGVACRCSLCVAGRQQCALDLTLNAQRRQCEGLPSLDIIRSRAADGQSRVLTTVRFRRPEL